MWSRDRVDSGGFVRENLRTLMVSVLAFLMAWLVACFASIFCMVGTQGLHGTEPFFSIFMPVSGLLAVANGIPGLFGLLPVLDKRGFGAWRAGMTGILVGVAIEAAMFGWFMANIFTVPLPFACGALALLLHKDEIPALE